MTPDDIINATEVTTLGGLLATLQREGDAVMKDELGNQVWFSTLQANCHASEGHTDVLLFMQVPYTCCNEEGHG